jgi:hypothetical protein
MRPSHTMTTHYAAHLKPSSPPSTRRRLIEEIAGIEADLITLKALIEQAATDRLAEAETSATGTGTVKPLSPDQARKRADRDRDRQERIRAIQTSTASRIASIRSKIGR